MLFNAVNFSLGKLAIGDIRDALTTSFKKRNLSVRLSVFVLALTCLLHNIAQAAASDAHEPHGLSAGSRRSCTAWG